MLLTKDVMEIMLLCCFYYAIFYYAVAESIPYHMDKVYLNHVFKLCHRKCVMQITKSILTYFKLFFQKGNTGHICKEDIENVLLLRTTLTQAASILGISRPTLYKLMRQFHISRSKFVPLTHDELDSTISEIKAQHPHLGEVMLNGHLHSRGIVVQRHRLRESIRRVDATGVELRRTGAITRRVYNVPWPNFIWHIDSNHRLI